KRIQKEYYLSRPVAVLISIDSFSDVTSDIPESEVASMRGAVEKEIESFAKQANSFVRRLSNQRYILMLEERNVKSMIDSKFAILDKVRSMTFNGEKGIITLSIGVGRGAGSIAESETAARQALDMAQGRGGDQAALKTDDGYEFFGGVSKGIEKRSKIKTRVIASAVKELIISSDNVFIMGHKFADLDALGAACAMRKIAEKLGKHAYIVLDRGQNLAKQLMRRIDEAEEDEAIIEPEDAIPLISGKSLLIIVDTHRAAFVESPELYEKIQDVIVIDHHRKTVDFINDAVVFYHETYASSACEMVSELSQYMGEKLIGKNEAEALLSGIMLDTKNFILRTGVRTFEASAYLRSLGADPVEVKKLFAGNIDEYKEKSELVANARFFKNCAIAGGRPDGAVSRIAAAQAADELLNIEGVDASFVMFLTGKTVNISARSLGAVNVQIIMEKLGGGGHMTMAAAQLEGMTYEEAVKRLAAAIDACRKEDN
ncbi:MAG: DHH family phosphoesterase, partial [Acutalibacteraceae bacterium]